VTSPVTVVHNPTAENKGCTGRVGNKHMHAFQRDLPICLIADVANAT